MQYRRLGKSGMDISEIACCEQIDQDTGTASPSGPARRIERAGQQ